MSGHLCWSTEPWYAWDVWSDVPGATNTFELMVNGGYAWVPHTIRLSADIGDSVIVLPLIEEVEPSIDDVYPTYDDHGLWISCRDITREGVWPMTNDEDEPGYGGLAIFTNLLTTRSQLGHCRFYPWEVMPVLAKDSYENGDLYDHLGEELQSMVDNEVPPFDFKVLTEYLRKEAQDKLEEIGELQLAWREHLFRIAALHDCAELLVPETMHSPYRHRRASS